MSELLKRAVEFQKKLDEALSKNEALTEDDIKKINDIVFNMYGDVKVTPSELLDRLYPKILVEKLPEGTGEKLYEEINNVRARLLEIKNTINGAARNLEELPNSLELMDEYKDAKRKLRTLLHISNFRYGKIPMEEKRFADHEKLEMLKEGLKEIIEIAPDPYRLPTEHEWDAVQKKTTELFDKVFPEGKPEVDLSPFMYTPKPNEPKRYTKVSELNLIEGPGESRSNTSDYPLVLRGKVVNTNEPNLINIKNRKKDDE
jgi:hypothetical protein